MTFRLVVDAAGLQEAAAGLAASPYLVIDTEFIRERTYYPQLCLIQIADAAGQVLCIDPLACTDLTPLRPLLFDPAILKVLHAARQDLEIFFHLWDGVPTPLYDTQIAAALLGLGEQIGYAALVKEVLGIDIDKSQSRTDWARRPLSERQLHYAADDVRYLAQIYPRQRQQLEALGRLAWLDADFLELADAALYRPDPDDAWRKIKGINRLQGVQLAILRELAAWREYQAMSRDRPRRQMLSDEMVIDIARHRPRRIADLAELRGLTQGLVAAHGAALIECVERAAASSKESWPRLPDRRRSGRDEEALVDILSGILKHYAARHNITPASLCGRKELELLVQGDDDLAILKGWRLEHAGKHLVSFLEGQGRLGVLDGKLDFGAAFA